MDEDEWIYGDLEEGAEGDIEQGEDYVDGEDQLMSDYRKFWLEKYGNPDLPERIETERDPALEERVKLQREAYFRRLGIDAGALANYPPYKSIDPKDKPTKEYLKERDAFIIKKGQ